MLVLGTKGCPSVCCFCRWVQHLEGEDEERGVSQVQTVIDSGLYVDWGLLSGLAAKSELRELLDELYGSLS